MGKQRKEKKEEEKSRRRRACCNYRSSYFCISKPLLSTALRSSRLIHSLSSSTITSLPSFLIPTLPISLSHLLLLPSLLHCFIPHPVSAPLILAGEALSLSLPFSVSVADYSHIRLCRLSVQLSPSPSLPLHSITLSLSSCLPQPTLYARQCV